MSIPLPYKTIRSQNSPQRIFLALRRSLLLGLLKLQDLLHNLLLFHQECPNDPVVGDILVTFQELM